MPDLIIKPAATSGNKLILKDQAGGAVLTTADSGATIAGATIINTTGAITTTGAFTSVGIDDNADATAITIDSNEYVGIGTASNTTYPLHIQKDTDNFTAKIENDGNSTSSDGLWVDTRWNTATNTLLKVTTNSGATNVLYVKGDGKIGIGISNPGVGFANIAGTGTNVHTDGFMWNGGAASKYVAQFRNGSDPGWGLSVKLGISAPEPTDHYLDFLDDEGVIQCGFTGTSEADGGLAIQTAGIERMRNA